MADVLKKVPVREQDPKVRATNFEEVCYGYNQEEAMEEASRCINCKNAKCIQGCPVGINIPAFVHEVKEGNIEEAYKIIGQSSALPAVCGRVCPQESQCEGKCIRGIKGESISIGKLERFVADYALEHDIKPVGADKKNGHKVAVIGSGPAGLTCAGDLAKLGYDVTVFEALHELGGVLVYGIPEFRLPKQKVVAKEIAKVKELGVHFETNVVIGKSTTIDMLIEDEGFEAVFIGSGAGLPKFMGIPGENANGVFSANEYLTRSNLMKAFDDSYDTPIAAGKKVAVVGGGNVAMDAARTALRLGAEVHIVYRRSEEDHGEVRVVFTTDEEIGCGVDGLDVAELACDYGYTVDGGPLGEIEYENFNAAGAKVVVHGLNIHPGSAKGKMVNSQLIAMEFQSLLPVGQRPELTEGYEGFFHLLGMKGEVERSELHYIIRDHDMEKFEEKKAVMTAAADFINRKYGAGTLELTLKDSYYNMKEKIEPCMFLVDQAKSAMLELGIAPKVQPIRGGTDGARLSFEGLPCPNLCAGGENFHGRFEYVPVEDMEKITKLLATILWNIAK